MNDDMIKRLEARRADVAPPIQDIDEIDRRATDAASARLAKAGGFPVEGAHKTENEEVAKRAKREREKLLHK